MNKIQRALFALQKAESTAQRGREMIDNAERKWNDSIKTLRETPEWRAYCTERGIDPRYSFRDVLA